MRLSRVRGLALAVLLPMFAGGCQSIGAITGAVVGAASGAGTTNPLVGYAVGIGVAAGVDELQAYIARSRDGAEQDVIATAAGQMRPGEVRAWKIVHDIPLFDDEHGTIQVTRTIDTPLAQCKEVLFTVDEGRGAKLRRTGLATAACHDSTGWQWAEAEPATDRWGYFQHHNF